MTTQDQTPDMSAIKERMQKTWTSGDFAKIGNRPVVVGESLREAVDLRSGDRVLDVATRKSTATRWQGDQRVPEGNDASGKALRPRKGSPDPVPEMADRASLGRRPDGILAGHRPAAEPSDRHQLSGKENKPWQP